jgi:hypothetical protein
MSVGSRHVQPLRRAIPALIAIFALASCASSSATEGGSTPTSGLTPIIVVITPTPAISTAASTAAPTSRAAACSGTDANRTFFADGARDLSFDVYCAVLPSGWWVDSGSYDAASGGYLQVDYKTSGSANFTLREGRWCPPEKACIAHGPAVGTASFDGMTGPLCLNAGTFNLEIGTWANPRYLMVGHGMTQAQFTALSAALIKVPKP